MVTSLVLPTCSSAAGLVVPIPTLPLNIVLVIFALPNVTLLEPLP